MNRFFLVLICVLAIGRSGMAQSDKTFKFSMVAYDAAVVADTAMTLQLLSRGGFREANPLLSPFQDSPLKLAGIKIGLAVGSTYGLIELRKHKPRLAFWLTVGGVAINGFAAAHNARHF